MSSGSEGKGRKKLLLGAHMSIGGGVHLSLIRGAELGCTAIQIFTKSARGWYAKPIPKEDVLAFKENVKKTGIWPVVAHTSYLIDLGTPDPERLQKSRDSLVVELERAELLGIPCLVLHPGSHLGKGEDEGIKRIAESLNLVHERTKGFRVKIALETTAGQGTNLGYRFEQIARMIELTEEDDRLVVCYDTCHTFAAGYDIRTREGYERTFAEFDEIIGLNRLRVFHLNDSKGDLGSRLDRHIHIGEGKLGVEPFRMLLNDPRFYDLPFIIETPKEDDWDRRNLELLRSLAS